MDGYSNTLVAACVVIDTLQNNTKFMADLRSGMYKNITEQTLANDPMTLVKFCRMIDSGTQIDWRDSEWVIEAH